MEVGGLAAKVAFLKDQLKSTPCKRCGLNYDHKALVKCPHCSHLDEKGLQELFEKKEFEYQARKPIGIVFFILALMSLILIILNV